MSGAQVSLFRCTIENLTEDIDKSASFVGFVSEQLHLIHEKKETAMTVFQLAALLELVDSGLTNQSELLKNALT